MASQHPGKPPMTTAPGSRWAPRFTAPKTERGRCSKSSGGPIRSSQHPFFLRPAAQRRNGCTADPDAPIGRRHAGGRATEALLCGRPPDQLVDDRRRARSLSVVAPPAVQGPRYERRRHPATSLPGESAIAVPRERNRPPGCAVKRPRSRTRPAWPRVSESGPTVKRAARRVSIPSRHAL